MTKKHQETPNFPLALSFDDVLLQPQFSEINSRSEINLETKISSKLTLQIPLISANMDTITGVKMAIAMGNLGGMGILPRFDSPEIQVEKMTQIVEAGVIGAGSLGIKEGFLETAEKLVQAGATVLTIDVAHGHLKKAVDATKKLAERFGKQITIISGVVGTYEGAADLFKAGADSIMLGVGPGSTCTTRIQTGHGVPQITALLECTKAKKEFGGTILANGGTKNSGDIVKALAAGASAIISGFNLAGTDEAPGEVIELSGKKYKEHNGSTSAKEKMKHLEKYGKGKGSNYVKHVEGVESLVPYKGPVGKVVGGLMAGVRSGLSYSGAINVEELWRKARFMQITSAGMRESGAHDIIQLE